MTSNRRWTLGKLVAASALVLVSLLVLITNLGQRWIAEGLSRVSPGAVYFVDTDRPAVALTIDDGPDPVASPRILDVLDRHGARATFFLITERVPGNEAVLERMLDEGHEIGNHMTRDEASISLPSEAFERDLLAAHEVLSRFAAQRWFRPGSGYFNREMLKIAERHGYTTVLGSAYPFDSEIPSTSFAERHILANVRPGSIIILHDVGDRGLRAAATLEAILPELAARGLEVTTLSGLIDGA